MRSNFHAPTRRSRFPTYLLGVSALLLLMVGGTLATLWMLGINLNPFGGPLPEDPYMVRIPINAQPIPAYTRVDRMQLINPTTGGLMVQKVPPDSAVGMSIVGVDAQGSHAEGRVEAVKNVNDEVVFVLADNREVRHTQTTELGGALMNVNNIVGRVVKRDKRAGMGFTENTFFAQGTPEGIAGATPAGMRAITLDATKLTGVHALNSGDQVDLIASFPAGSNPTSSASLSIPGQDSSKGASSDASHDPVLLAQNAIVLKPVYVRNEASTSASLTQGTRVQNIPKYEVAIAVKPDDIIPLQRALNQSLVITCIAHSMKPDDASIPVAAVPPADEVLVPVTVRAILAYDVVARDAFVSPATRALKTERLSRQQVDRQDIITSLDEALGAITRHDIPSGRFLRRSDLLSGPPGTVPASQNRESNARPADRVTQKPWHHGANEAGHHLVSLLQESSDAAPSATVVGDRPAITRFVPPGKTAFAIPWNRVYGSEHLQIGDQIDLMASYSLESTDEEEETETRADGTVVVRKSDSLAVRETQRTWDESFGFRAEPWFVASDAVVIAPVGFPAPASALRVLSEQLYQRSASGGANSSPTLSGPPIIIAVDDRDVEAVTTALATRDALFTVAFHASGEVAGTLSANSKQIVVASEPIPPYQEFNESLWKGNRRRITSRIVSIEDSRFDQAITIEQVHLYYGRVVGQPKSRGDYLTATDFLPAGTKAGLASAARRGHTMFAVADREIEGLDSFDTEDHVAILIRGVVNPPAGVTIEGADFSRPVATVVVQDVRIARASLAGQTVLEIANEDLNPLQAALARSLTDNADAGGRSHLIAVVKPRGNGAEQQADASETIPAFDPLANVQYTEIIIGRTRTVRAFAGQNSTNSLGGGR